MTTHDPDDTTDTDDASTNNDASTNPDVQPDPLESELEEGLQHLGNVLGGVATRLLGPAVTGRNIDDRPTISPAADALISDMGANLGRLFNAAGRALESHPSAPGAALDAAARDASTPVSPAEGEAPLTAGLRSLGRGLAATSEAMLDRVAPRTTTGAEE